MTFPKAGTNPIAASRERPLRIDERTLPTSGAGASGVGMTVSVPVRDVATNLLLAVTVGGSETGERNQVIETVRRTGWAVQAQLAAVRRRQLQP
ncbi:MAG: hypothetical protein WAU75_04255 [Solirubrobacteraceae bacterium]